MPAPAAGLSPPGTPYRLLTARGQVVTVRGGRIAAVHDTGGRRQGEVRAGYGGNDVALTLDLGDAELQPGLINAHDHLHRNHYPRLGSPPYPDAYAWGLDLHERHAAALAALRALDRMDALLFGALKNILGGATTVVHHDPWEPAFDAGFPVRVARVRTAHSLRFEPALAAAVTAEPLPSFGHPACPLCLHLAEGVTPEMGDEVRQAASLGLLDRRLLAVHCVAVDDDGAARLRAAGSAVVWCPTSNRFLFGRTVPAALLQSGVDVLLGTDALLTGDGTLLDELRAARRLGVLDDDRLLAAVGRTAARRLGLPEPALAPGASADLMALRRPIFDAGPRDLALLVVAGRPVLGDEAAADLFAALDVPAESLAVAGGTKLVAAPLAQVAARVLALAPEAGRILEHRPRETRGAAPDFSPPPECRNLARPT